MSKLDALREYLAACQPGPIADVDEIARFLANCWDELEGSDEEAMEPYKVRRMEEVVWDPPKLCFLIERHGGTVMGSSRAELQYWTVDVSKACATVCDNNRYRQLHPRQPNLDVGPLVDDIVEKITNGKQDLRLKWLGPDSVRVEVGQIIPSGSGVKQTVAARRKRFKSALRDRLKTADWEQVTSRLNTFVRGRPGG